MFADPLLTPLTVCTGLEVLVAPAGMVKLEGDTAATAELLLASVMVTPPEGAAVPNVTGKFTVLPAATVTPEGSRMPPAAACVTVTVAVAPAIPAALAVMVTDPAATPVTGTDKVVLVPKVIAAGTVATDALLELRLTTSPAGAGADRFSVKSCVTVPLIVMLPGEKPMVIAAPPATCTWALAVAYPGAEAVMVADPALLPVTVGTVREAVSP
jgi:hypothetical protein